MAKKKEESAELKTLRQSLQAGKAIIGTERVLKALKTKTLTSVYLAQNCPAHVKGDVEYYAKLANVPIISLALDNEELGVFCKKNFFVSVLGTQ